MRNASVLLLAMTGLLGVAAVPASASTAGFDFAQCSADPNYYGVAQTESSGCGSAGYSNTSGSFSQTIGSGANAITVTATALVTKTDSSAVGTALESGNDAAVGQYTGYGLGVCSIGDSGYSTSNPGDGCTAPAHQVDDSGNYEFILLTFSTPVNIADITLANFGGLSSQTETQQLDAMGFTYWVNPSSESEIIAGGTTVLCGTSDAPTCPTSEGNGDGVGTGSWTTGFGTDGQNTLTGVTQLLVGAALSEDDDFI